MVPPGNRILSAAVFSDELSSLFLITCQTIPCCSACPISRAAPSISGRTCGIAMKTSRVRQDSPAAAPASLFLSVEDCFCADQALSRGSCCHQEALPAKAGTNQLQTASRTQRTGHRQPPGSSPLNRRWHSFIPGFRRAKVLFRGREPPGVREGFCWSLLLRALISTRERRQLPRILSRQGAAGGEYRRH